MRLESSTDSRDADRGSRPRDFRVASWPNPRKATYHIVIDKSPPIMEFCVDTCQIPGASSKVILSNSTSNTVAHIPDCSTSTISSTCIMYLSSINRLKHFTRRLSIFRTSSVTMDCTRHYYANDRCRSIGDHYEQDPLDSYVACHNYLIEWHTEVLGTMSKA